MWYKQLGIFEKWIWRNGFGQVGFNFFLEKWGTTDWMACNYFWIMRYSNIAYSKLYWQRVDFISLFLLILFLLWKHSKSQLSRMSWIVHLFRIEKLCVEYIYLVTYRNTSNNYNDVSHKCNLKCKWDSRREKRKLQQILCS